jgi:hypothetical protein
MQKQNMEWKHPELSSNGNLESLGKLITDFSVSQRAILEQVKPWNLK